MQVLVLAGSEFCRRFYTSQEQYISIVLLLFIQGIGANSLICLFIYLLQNAEVNKQLQTVSKATEEQQQARQHAEKFVQELQKSVDEKKSAEDQLKQKMQEEQRKLLGSPRPYVTSCYNCVFSFQFQKIICLMFQDFMWLKAQIF